MQEMMQRAQALGARSSSARLLPTGRKNAIVGIDIDYETVGANGSMLMVATSGAAEPSVRKLICHRQMNQNISFKLHFINHLCNCYIIA